MNKKKTNEEIKAEILASFPGTLVKNKRNVYVPNKEQRVWLLNNVDKYNYNQIHYSLGLTQYSQLKALSEEDPSYIAKFIDHKGQKLACHKIWYLKQKSKLTADLRGVERRRSEMKEAARKKKPTEPKEPKVWQWDIDEALRKAEEAKKKRAAEKAALKAERAEDMLNRKCYEKRKDIERKPKPFSIDEQVLRQKAYDHFYILPDGDELFTDRRRCIYWDEETKRSKKVEEEADRLKFNVIEYRRMFPNMGNSLSSCVTDYNEIID